MKKPENTVLCDAENRTVEPSDGCLSEGKGIKKKFALWAYPETLDNVSKYREIGNASSKSEFIENAIRFYVGYLKAVDNTDYLSPIFTASVEGALSEIEKRLSRSFYKNAVTLNMLTQLFANVYRVGNDTLKELENLSVDNVNHLGDAISFRSAYKYQKENS